MSLKNLFATRQKRQSGAISLASRIDAFVIKKQDWENDRAPNVISPSSASACVRELVMTRFLPRAHVDPRVQRIFDNGTDVGIRYQNYLRYAGALLQDEVPLYNEEYNVQGHADGLVYALGNVPKSWWGEAIVLKWNEKWKRAYWEPQFPKIYEVLKDVYFKSVEVLELKSINDKQFRALKDAKEEHKDQAMTYVWLAEERRHFLLKKYPTWEEFVRSHDERMKEHERRYKFLPPDKRHLKCLECCLTDAILYRAQNPVNRVIYIYECKNDQEFNEFTVKFDPERLKRLKKKYKIVEKHVKRIRAIRRITGLPVDFSKKIYRNALPPMPEEATGKTCDYCKWCELRDYCYGES